MLLTICVNIHHWKAGISASAIDMPSSSYYEGSNCNFHFTKEKKRNQLALVLFALLPEDSFELFLSLSFSLTLLSRKNFFFLFLSFSYRDCQETQVHEDHQEKWVLRLGSIVFYLAIFIIICSGHVASVQSIRTLS